jgi:hypothetical protein
MRLNGVEIKVSLSDRGAVRAVELLELGGKGEPRSVGFIEDITVGVELPLFRQGVVLRVREVQDGDDDATVKLRPCRRSQLAESWLGAEKGDGWKLRVEEDWAGTRRTLAASCVADLPSRRIAAVREGKEAGGSTVQQSPVAVPVRLCGDADQPGRAHPAPTGGGDAMGKGSGRGCQRCGRGALDRGQA